MLGSCRDQQRAAVFDILRDVVIVEDRQHAAVLVAIEDDQVELVDLVDEEFAGREGDQRELVDRRAVLLFRRAQNGEVHEVDRCVGLQEVAPGALAGVRLAGDEQHAQVLANALDDMDGAVVGRGDLAFDRLDLEFEDVVAAARHGEAERLFGAGLGDLGCDLVAIKADGDARRRFRADAVINHAEFQLLRLADNAEARGADDLDAAVEFVLPAGDERVHRRIETGKGGGFRNVVHLAVGDEDRAADARARHIGNRRVQGVEQAGGGRVGRAVVAGFHDARLNARVACEPLLEPFQRGIGLGGALLVVLALAAVDDDRDNGGQGLAVLLQENRIGERQHEQRQGECADEGAAQAAPEAEGGEREAREPDNDNGDPGQEGGELHGHVTAPAVRGGRERGPDPPCSCR
jgi:hypothetical protein